MTSPDTFGDQPVHYSSARLSDRKIALPHRRTDAVADVPPERFGMLSFITAALEGLRDGAVVGVIDPHKRLSPALADYLNTSQASVSLCDINPATQPGHADTTTYDALIDSTAEGHGDTFARLKPGGLYFAVHMARGNHLSADTALWADMPPLCIDNVCLMRKALPKTLNAVTIWAIVPIHNGLPYILSCLDSLSQQNTTATIKVMVVDDGSQDDSSDAIRGRFPDVEIIEGTGDLWWTGAVAKAVNTLHPRMAADDFFLLVNHDVTLAPDTVDCLVRRALMDRGIGWAPTGHTGEQPMGCAEAGHAPYHVHPLVRSMVRGQGSIDVEALFGRCSLYPVGILDDIDNFDAQMFPHYWGDSDFCFRAAEHGYRFRMTGETSVRVHHTTESTGTHHSFLEQPQSVASAWSALTDVKSYYNVKYMWRFLSRHQKRGRTARTAKTIVKVLGQIRRL